MILNFLEIFSWTIPDNSDNFSEDYKNPVFQAFSRGLSMSPSRIGYLHDHSTLAKPAVSAGTLVVCPVVFGACQGGQGEWMKEVYRLAYEQARAALAPTWYDRAAQPSPN